MSEQLIKRLREQRMTWIVVDDASVPQKRLRIIRPTEVEIAQHMLRGGEAFVGFEQVVLFVVDWDGVTEADLLGAAVGAADPVAFSTALWREVASDRVSWVRLAAQAILDAAATHSEKVSTEAKN